MKFDFEMSSKNLLHHACFPSAKQAVVNKNAGKLLANRFVKERCGHTRIDAAAQTENDSFLADLCAQVRYRLVHIIVHGPVPAATADMMDKVVQDFRAARSVGDFRVELEAEELLGPVLDGGVSGVFGDRH